MERGIEATEWMEQLGKQWRQETAETKGEWSSLHREKVACEGDGLKWQGKHSDVHHCS